jgi:hypothetical protein
MKDLSDDADTNLSEAELDKVAESLASAPPTQTVAPPTSPSLSLFLSKVLSPPNTSNDILRALDDMTIPSQVAEKLQPLFAALGLSLEREVVTDPHNNTKKRFYTAAKAENVEVVAVLHLPPWVLQTSDAIPFLTSAITNISDRHGRIISIGVDAPTYGYKPALQSVSDRVPNSWMFVPWAYVLETLDNITPTATVFEVILPAKGPGPAVAPAARKWPLDQADIDAIVDIFVKEAALDPDFFKGLVAASDWPDPLITKANAGLKGNASNDAHFLLTLLTQWNRYNVKHQHEGDTYLGWMLLRLLPSLGTPGETVADIILRYKLVSGAANIQAAKDRLKEK